MSWREGIPIGSMKPVLFLLLIVIAFFLRVGDLGKFNPIAPDEISWMMVGASLIEKGAPSSWTMFPHKNVAMSEGCRQAVTPFLAHPPAFSLVVGGWAWLVGETDWCVTNWAQVRVPMIIISILTIIVTFLFVRRVFDNTTANFVLLAFVFFPTHVVTSRIIAAEHLIGLFLMLGLYLFVVFETTKNDDVKRVAGGGMFLLCAVSIMIKLSAVVIPATLCFLALYKQRWRLGVILILASFASVLILLGYVYYYDWGIFLSDMTSHYSRAQNFAHFWTIFTSLNIGDYGLYDPSMIVGLVGAVTLAARTRARKNAIIIFVPLLFISLLFLYVAPSEMYGWYKYLIYPLIAVGLGHVFAQLYKQRYEYLILFLPLLGIMLQHSGILDDPSDRRMIVLVFYFLAGLPILLRGRFLQLRPIFISLLIFLFAFEIMWSMRVLGYISIV